MEVRQVIKFKQDTDLVLTAAELRRRYFFGIPIVDQSGKAMLDEDLEFYIRAATEEVERHLAIKLKKQIIEEQQEYLIDQARAWMLVKTTYPIREAFELNGQIGGATRIVMPKSWLSVTKNSDDRSFSRLIRLVPSPDSSPVHNLLYTGIYPNFSAFGTRTLPNHWNVIYCTGWDVIPNDILNFIGLLTAVNIFHILGDLILGAGIAEQSLAIDGLMQSISTTSSAENSGYSARIKGYITDMKNQLPKLEAAYRGIVFGVL